MVVPTRSDRRVARNPKRFGRSFGLFLPRSGTIKKGHHLRIIDTHGKQAVDFLRYNAHDRDERYFAPNTIKAAGTISSTKGQVLLFSDQAQPLFTIVEDTYGSHDTIGLLSRRRH